MQKRRRQCSRSGSARRVARARQARAEWFRKDEEFDDEIRRRFGEAVAIALAGGLGEWCATRRGSLARVLLLDQFTRNIFRGTPRAFAGDERALATAEDAVARGFDRELRRYERWFMYMPFEHAEDVDGAASLARALRGARAARWATTTRSRGRASTPTSCFRFGRYPHRNAILGRASTPEEEAFLQEPGVGF